MDEYIDRKETSNACYMIYEETVRNPRTLGPEEVQTLLLRFEKAIKGVPSASVAPVIFCRECAHHGRCAAESIYLSEGIPEPFCCRGKPKEGSKNG